MTSMANFIGSGDNELAYVDYGDLLDKITQHLQNVFAVSQDTKRLSINIDAVASHVANLGVDNPLGAAANSAKSATVNFSPGFEKEFPRQIQAIAHQLQTQLESVVSRSIHEFVRSLVTDLQTFKGNTANLDFTYPFTPYSGLQKQRLTFPNSQEQGQKLLRFHKLVITVYKKDQFNQQLQAGLENYIQVQFKSKSEAEREDLSYILDDLHKEQENPEFDFYRLQRIFDTETLGKLKKQAQISYLEFLYENINIDASTANAEGASYLQDLIRRLRLLEEYIDNPTQADGDYLVNYAGVSVNYRDLFSRAEAFEMLPIIPKIEGYLGETKDEARGEIHFTFGLKLKFDGKVAAYGNKTVFEYYHSLLDPDSQEHQAELANPQKKEIYARKVLKIAFLYFFLFACRPDTPIYDPVTAFDQKILPILKGDDEAAKQDLFRNIIKGFAKYRIQDKITQLKSLLEKVIQYQTAFPSREYPLHISISPGILETDINQIYQQNTFFKPVLRGNPKEVLKYISVGDAIASRNSVCTLPAKITISDIQYISTEDRQSFGMEYDLTGIRTLPILFLPFQDKRCQDVYNKYFRDRHLILFPYRLENIKLESQQAFIYRFTFSLLAYICLQILFKKQSRLFIPILRLHLHNKEDDAPIEKFIVSLSGVLSHLLNELHRANAQGIDIRDLQSKGKYKIPNVMSSLYSVLPKKFTATANPELVDKLAIIVVSSRESDRRWGSDQKLSNLMGEILSLRRQDQGIRVQLLKTFSDNYENQQMFRQPTVIIDEVAKLYQKGYRHFVYIAKAPYSSTLHMTQKAEDDGLFFMSKEVIRSVKAQHNDIKIYPIFYDKYYAVKLPPIGVSSLYIQDTAALTNLIEDPSQKSVMFFNLFNGIDVGKEHNYNGVISYSTLLNIYKDILDDEDIRRGLIYKGDLKDDILQYLTLFHFSRYEKAKEINLKLDPYENLIGENSVGGRCLFNHMRGKGEFNSLAFLTEVRKVLNAE